MITDHLLNCSLALSVILAENATVSSLYSIDTASRDIGTGTPLKGHVKAKTAIVGADEGLKMEYIESAAADLSNPVVLASKTSGVEPAAGDVLWDFVLPANALRYVGFRFTAMGSNLTAGTVDARILRDTQNNTPKPDAL